MAVRLQGMPVAHGIDIGRVRQNHVELALPRHIECSEACGDVGFGRTLTLYGKFDGVCPKQGALVRRAGRQRKFQLGCVRCKMADRVGLTSMRCKYLYH